MAKVPWLTKYHAAKHYFDPMYKGLSWHDRLKAEYAYGVGKRMFGVTDPEGRLVPHGTPQYEMEKEVLRNSALETSQGRRPNNLRVLEQ